MSVATCSYALRLIHNNFQYVQLNFGSYFKSVTNFSDAHGIAIYMLYIYALFIYTLEVQLLSIIQDTENTSDLKIIYLHKLASFSSLCYF